MKFCSLCKFSKRNSIGNGFILQLVQDNVCAQDGLKFLLNKWHQRSSLGRYSLGLQPK